MSNGWGAVALLILAISGIPVLDLDLWDKGWRKRRKTYATPVRSNLSIAAVISSSFTKHVELTLKRHMSHLVEQMSHLYIYRLACTKLGHETLQPSPDLRRLVGHANLIDIIDEEIEKYEWQRFSRARHDTNIFIKSNALPAAQSTGYQLNESEWKTLPTKPSIPSESVLGSRSHTEIVPTKLFQISDQWVWQLPTRNNLSLLRIIN